MRRHISELRAQGRRRKLAGRPQQTALEALLRSKTVFVHVPKCGGKAVITRLYGVGEHDWFGHPDVAFFKGLLGPSQFDSFTKFAVLRDPVARCRSAFYFVRQGGFGLSPMQSYSEKLQGLEFDSFVQDGVLAEYAQSYLLFRPQYKFICDAQGRVLVDHLCHTDRMGADLNKAVGHILPVDKLTRVNASEYGRSEQVSATTKDMIETLYTRDCDLYHSNLGAA